MAGLYMKSRKARTPNPQQLAQHSHRSFRNHLKHLKTLQRIDADIEENGSIFTSLNRLCRYWGHCYLDDSASDTLHVLHVLLLLPDGSSSVCSQLSPLLWFKSSCASDTSFSFYFDPFPMPSLNHSALSPYIAKFLNQNYSHMPVWTQQSTKHSADVFHPATPPTRTSGRHPAGLGLTLRGSTANQKALGSIPTSCLPCGNISLT